MEHRNPKNRCLLKICRDLCKIPAHSSKRLLGCSSNRFVMLKGDSRPCLSLNSPFWGVFLPFRQQQAHEACWPPLTGSGTSLSNDFAPILSLNRNSAPFCSRISGAGCQSSVRPHNGLSTVGYFAASLHPLTVCLGVPFA